jgi:hypothetical protein
MGRWRTIRGHHAVIERLLLDVGGLVVDLLCDNKLLVSNLVSCCIVSGDDSLDSSLSLANTLCVVCNQQDVLFIFIVWLRS